VVARTEPPAGGELSEAKTPLLITDPSGSPIRGEKQSSRREQFPLLGD